MRLDAADGSTLPVRDDHARARKLEELDRLANMLDAQWRIPGLGLRFGVDAVAGLAPVIGDAATGAISAWIIFKAWRLGATKGVLGQMIANTAIDTVVGAVPLLGSVFDLFFKANNRNMALLKRHVEHS